MNDEKRPEFPSQFISSEALRNKIGEQLAGQISRRLVKFVKNDNGVAVVLIIKTRSGSWRYDSHYFLKEVSGKKEPTNATADEVSDIFASYAYDEITHWIVENGGNTTEENIIRKRKSAKPVITLRANPLPERPQVRASTKQQDVEQEVEMEEEEGTAVEGKIDQPPSEESQHQMWPRENSKRVLPVPESTLSENILANIKGSRLLAVKIQSSALLFQKPVNGKDLLERGFPDKNTLRRQQRRITSITQRLHSLLDVGFAQVFAVAFARLKQGKSGYLKDSVIEWTCESYAYDVRKHQKIPECAGAVTGAFIRDSSQASLDTVLVPRLLPIRENVHFAKSKPRDRHQPLVRSNEENNSAGDDATLLVTLRSNLLQTKLPQLPKEIVPETDEGKKEYVSELEIPELPTIVSPPSKKKVSTAPKT